MFALLYTTTMNMLTRMEEWMVGGGIPRKDNEHFIRVSGRMADDDDVPLDLSRIKRRLQDDDDTPLDLSRIKRRLQDDDDTPLDLSKFQREVEDDDDLSEMCEEVSESLSDAREEARRTVRARPHVWEKCGPDSWAYRCIDCHSPAVDEFGDRGAAFGCDLCCE